MRNTKPAKYGVLIAVLLLAAACSSSGKLTVTSPKVGAIGDHKTVSLNIIQGKEVESTRIVTELRNQLFGRLVAENVFSQVVQPNDPADYKLDVEVAEASEVSTGARIMLGVLAGSNSIKCNVKLVDQSTNLVKTAFTVEGESASHPMSTENGLADAVREAVTNMITALR